METKQRDEAIKKAVSDYYDQYPLIKPYVQDNGYFPITNGYISNLDENVREFYRSLDGIDYLQAEDHEEYHSHFRPKDLSDIIKNIEENNGWTKISEDLSNLKEGIFEFIIHPDCRAEKKYKEVVHVNRALIENKDMAWHVYTHFKPIQFDQLPIW